MPTPQDVATAWHSIAARWLVRRNEANEPEHRFEVVVDEAGKLEVIGSFATEGEADNHRKRCEDWARGTVVLNLINQLVL